VNEAILANVAFLCLGVLITLGCVYAGASLAWRFQNRPGTLIPPRPLREPKEPKVEGAVSTQIPDETE